VCFLLEDSVARFFDPRFFPSNKTHWAPDSWAKAILTFDSNLPKMCTIFERDCLVVWLGNSRRIFPLNVARAARTYDSSIIASGVIYCMC
jgi:hypothetical protein